MSKETKEFIERCKKLEVLSVFLTLDSFMDLLNTEEAVIVHLNLPLDVTGKALYKQLANYQGLSVEANTSNKIYEV